MSEVVPCADFTFNVSIESGAKLFNSPGWDIQFAVMYDYLVDFVVTENGTTES